MDEQIKLPPGRMVQGSLYQGRETDDDGKPLVYKHGKDAGKPRKDFFFAVAIPKRGEAHWNQTEWGTKVWSVGAKGHARMHQNPHFAWKIVDGDSTVPNRRGTVPREQEGFAGHWIVRCSGSFAPKVAKAIGGTVEWDNTTDLVNPGDFIEAIITVKPNAAPAGQEGVYINPDFVCLVGYGTRINTSRTPDAATLGFGASPLPAGASMTPPAAAGFQAPPVAATVPPVVPNYTFMQPPPAPIVMPPVPAAPPVRRMTEKANGGTYEQYRSAGWSDEQLVQHGMMHA